MSRRGVVPLSIGAAVVAGVVLLPGGADAPTASVAAPATVVPGVVGSEKMSFFSDERVVKVLADNGIRVQVEPAGSRQIATTVDLGSFDFAFPSSIPAAERIQRQRNAARHSCSSDPRESRQSPTSLRAAST